jgi:carbon monoxide dehydrogenase subunit G
MATVEKSITVNVPVRTAYNQWTQFEEFPQFMEGVKSIRQLDDKNLHWRAKIGPKEEEWQAEIMEQIPDQRIAWRSTTGAKNGGVVTFHRLDENTTRIMLQIEYDPEGVVENVGDAMGVVDRRIEGDLKRFKEFIESRQQPTGAWRGEIHGQQVEPPSAPRPRAKPAGARRRKAKACPPWLLDAARFPGAARQQPRLTVNSPPGVLTPLGGLCLPQQQTRSPARSVCRTKAIRGASFTSQTQDFTARGR